MNHISSDTAVLISDFRFCCLVLPPFQSSRLAAKRSARKEIIAVSLPERSTTTTIRFGLWIINLSATPYRFHNYNLMPTIQNRHGQLLDRGYGRNATKPVTESNYFVAEPQSSLTFWCNSSLGWCGDKFCLWGYESSGGVWYFHDLDIGTYRACFTYENPSSTGKVQGRMGKLRDMYDDLWVGKVTTPSIEFKII